MTLSSTARCARGAAALAFLGVALRVRAPAARVGASWFALSHAVAAATGYDGCPELGAVASAVSRRRLNAPCGPWGIVDKALERRLARPGGAG